MGSAVLGIDMDTDTSVIFFFWHFIKNELLAWYMFRRSKDMVIIH
jgi:hypothetical protein